MTIRAENISFSYGQRRVLKNVSLSAGSGSFVTILGSNGVGKSTLFRCMLGLIKDYEGSVTVDGEDTRSMSVKQLAEKIAYIPQSTSPAFNYSVEDIVLMGTTAGMRPFSTPRAKELALVDSALGRMGIEHLRDRCFHLLSGGEKQLVIIARAIAQNAGIIMLDEPTASLDFGNQMLVLRRMRELADEGYTVIQTSHDPEHSYMFSDSITALKDGEVLISGTPGEVMREDVISSLYNIRVNIDSLYEDKVRVCTAAF